MMDSENTVDDSLIAKFFAGEATPEETMLISDWVDKSQENKLLFDQLQQAWALNQDAFFTASNKSRVWNSVTESIKSTKIVRVSFFTPLRIAATVFILLAAGAAVYFLLPTSPTKEGWITKNSKEEIFKLPLPEGTSIVLNKNSKLSYPKEFKGSTRTVKLSGEAFFDVVHNPDQPFIVDYGEVSVKVLGTSFNVSELKSSFAVETQVIRGKVMMYDKNNSIIIEAGWTGIYDRVSKKLSRRKTESENNVGYATHTFTFEDTSLKQVTDNLSNSFGVSFVFENEKLKDCRLTSSYNNKSLTFILDIITETLNLKYTVKENTVYLSGDGCF